MISATLNRKWEQYYNPLNFVIYWFGIGSGVLIYFPLKIQFEPSSIYGCQSYYLILNFKTKLFLVIIENGIFIANTNVKSNKFHVIGVVSLPALIIGRKNNFKWMWHWGCLNVFIGVFFLRLCCCIVFIGNIHYDIFSTELSRCVIKPIKQQLPFTTYSHLFHILS